MLRSSHASRVASPSVVPELSVLSSDDLEPMLLSVVSIMVGFVGLAREFVAVAFLDLLLVDDDDSRTEEGAFFHISADDNLSNKEMLCSISIRMLLSSRRPPRLPTNLASRRLGGFKRER